MDYLLPATVYQSPPRAGRGRQLNTIMEDNEEAMQGFTSESEGTASDNTVIGRPAALDVKYLCQRQQQSKQQPVNTYTRGPPSVVSSECDDDDMPQPSSRSSYAESDNGTVFSESCPSLTGSHASETTSFVTDSSRNSVASRNSRNRYPSLLIPRGSWHLEAEAKQMSFGMSPSTKVKITPESLERLPRNITCIDTPPSLADESSVASESPCLHSINSTPATPDMHNIEVIEGQTWGGQHHQLVLDTPLEIAIDDDHSMLLSPQEAHAVPYSAPYSAAGRLSNPWNDIVRQFPLIPGATPIEITPVTPNIPRGEGFGCLTDDAGVQLPAQAMEVLQNLNRPKYVDSVTGSSVSGYEQEMKECSLPPRPQSFCDKSPASEYSMSQLSIPSPGGFFSSLKAGARNTWCSPPRRTSPPPPSSTTAENFYNAPWTQASRVKETIIEVDNGNETDGPPTVKQAVFDHGVKSPTETLDMYGSSIKPSVSHEYEEAYEDGLHKAAEANMGRTSNWLSAQTTYLSALRETNPVNDPADFSATPVLGVEELDRKDSLETESRKAVRFLEQAKAAVCLENGTSTISDASTPTKETTFLQAFTYQKSETKRSDVFLHASSRLDSVQSTRIALPKRHVQSLLNTHTSKTLEPDHTRPKYRGPFSQNPRNTGDFSLTAEQAEFSTLERQQTALNAIKPNLWSLEAQRTILYNGRLMANSAASERLSKKDAESAQAEESEKPKKKRPRVLDLGGAATASWAWAAATKWPNAKVYTVQTKQQADLARNYPAPEEDVESYRPETPQNHKVFSVPHLWQVPFRDNYFDVVSARTLHMYLRANPVPGVESIDEWDMTLKECMRVLKPGGIFDFFVMDSGISNSSSSNNPVVNLSPTNMTSTNALPTPASEPKDKDITAEFKAELLRRGFETDGGCGRLMSRLKQEGFVGVKRQWIGLPMGRADNDSAAMRMHQRNGSNVSATSHWINQPKRHSARKPAFRFAPRPISEMSPISKFIDQYSDVEAVQGPVGSTTDVSDMSALLGELLWEEWLVRLRIESGRYSPETILEGIDEQFGEWRRSGKAAWRGVIGWARKPSKKEVNAAEQASTVSNASSVDQTARGFGHGFAIETPMPTPASLPPMSHSAPAGIQRRPSVRRQSRNMSSLSACSGLTVDTDITGRRSGVNDWSRRVNEVSVEDFTRSALDRGEVGEIPMMIVG